MLLVEWTPSLSTGIEIIDTQHQTLFKMINELSYATTQGRSREVLAELIQKLVVYSQTHFETEERMMTEYGFPGFREHKAIHAEFTNKLNMFKAEHEANKLDVPIRVMNFLNEWLTDHVLGTDMKYVTFYRDNGIVTELAKT